MKAREIKNMFLHRYAEEIQSYEQAKEDLARREAKIRLIQDDLKMYFGVVKKYDFGTLDVPF